MTISYNKWRKRKKRFSFNGNTRTNYPHDTVEEKSMKIEKKMKN